MGHVEVFWGSALSYPLYHNLSHTLLVDICILFTGRLGVGRKLFGADRGSFSSFVFVDVICWHDIRLMEEILHQLICSLLITYRVLHIPGVAGFLPSTVLVHLSSISMLFLFLKIYQSIATLWIPLVNQPFERVVPICSMSWRWWTSNALSVELSLTGSLDCQCSLSAEIQQIWIPKQAECNQSVQNESEFYVYCLRVYVAGGRFKLIHQEMFKLLGSASGPMKIMCSWTLKTNVFFMHRSPNKNMDWPRLVVMTSSPRCFTRQEAETWPGTSRVPTWVDMLMENN